MRIIEQTTKSIIVESNLPDTDYVVNPYTGCSFGCSYCYASFMGRFVSEPRDAWGHYVYVKTNAVELFSKEILALKMRETPPTLFLSSVTDAWQGPEKKYRLARGILKVLVDSKYPGRVSILTKSPLIERDLDLLKLLPHAEVGMTVTTDDDVTGAAYEARAPKNSDRLRVLTELSAAGVPTYAFIGPLMTHYVDEPAKLDHLLASIARSGVQFIYAELLNVSRNLIQRIQHEMVGSKLETETFINGQVDQVRRAALAEMVENIAKHHGLTLRLGRVLDHVADRKRKD